MLAVGRRAACPLCSFLPLHMLVVCGHMHIIHALMHSHQTELTATVHVILLALLALPPPSLQCTIA